MPIRFRFNALTFLPAVFAAALLTGCSASFVPAPTGSSTDTQSSGGGFSGHLHGGQQPVTGATISVYETGLGGLKTAATLKATTTTDTNGDFSFAPNAYTCDSGRLLYIVGTGGNPGGTGNNADIAQMAPLGLCGSIVESVDINEISTVVFAYAMAQYGSDYNKIGTSSTDTVGINIAMNNALNILNVGYGQVPGATQATNSIGTVPVNKIYYLANVLGACVNSTGNGCNNLFTDTDGAKDEAQAIFYIAQNPTKNVQTIYNLKPGANPFPETESEPTDWTLPITFSGVVTTPGNLSIDESGNVWVSDGGIISGGSQVGAVAKISPLGVKTSYAAWQESDSSTTTSPMGAISQVAVNTDDTVWGLDKSNSSIYRYDGTAWTPITGENLRNPVAISFSSAGSASVMNSGNEYISQFSSSGIGQAQPTYNQYGYDNGNLGTPKALATDDNGATFVSANGGCANCIGLLTSNNGSAYAYDDYSGTVESASAIIIDASGDPWQAQASGIVELPSYTSGSYQNYDIGPCLGFLGTTQGYYFNIASIPFINCAYANNTSSNITNGTGGLEAPVGLAIDGGGHLWAANSTLYEGTYGNSGTVSGFTGTTSLTGSNVGYTTGNTTATPLAVAPDPAGNLWTVNSDGSVSEILGLATPTKTPVYPGQIAKEP